MKKLLALILAILMMSVVFAGCDSGEPETEPTEAGFDYANATAEDLLAKIADQTNPTAEEYLWLIGTYSYVNITDDLELEENITDEAIDLLDDKIENYPTISKADLFDSKSPQVRGYGYKSIMSFFGASDETLSLAAEHLEGETDLYVLKSALKGLVNEGSNEDIGAFFTKMAKHENAIIRKYAAYALSNSWSKTVPNVIDIVNELMKDSDIDVQKAACSGAGSLDDEGVIDTLSEILMDESQVDLHDDCSKSLCTLCIDYPFYENTSEKAYNVLMEYYSITPRTDNSPNWLAVSNFSNKTTDEEKYNDWKERATYFDSDQIYSVMSDIIKDADAYWLSRTSAIKVIVNYCTDDQIQDLKTLLDGISDIKANSLRETYESAIKI